MPEIIEAEITKTKLAPAIKSRRILKFWTDWPRGLRSEKKSVRKTAKEIEGKKINKISRKGKVVVFHLEGGNILAVHQRMSGSLKFNRQGVPKKHTHFKLTLDNGTEVALSDPRKFGIVWYGSKEWFLSRPYIQKLGADAMRIKKEDFLELCGQSSASVKSFLLQQDKIAGLGNIACDEILWHAGIRPDRVVKELTISELNKLHKAMFLTLADILKHGGTSMSDWYHPDGKKGAYQNNFKVYGRNTCSRCGTKINAIKISGRGTSFCTLCQK